MILHIEDPCLICSEIIDTKSYIELNLPVVGCSEIILPHIMHMVFKIVYCFNRLLSTYTRNHGIVLKLYVQIIIVLEQ